MSSFINNIVSKLRQCLQKTPDNPYPARACIKALPGALGAWLAEWAEVWHKYDFFFDLIRCSRVTLFILLFAAVFLLLPNSQGAELTIRLSNELLHALIFLIGVFLWAFQAWIGTRKVMETVAARVEVEEPKVGVLRHLRALAETKTWFGRFAEGKALCARMMAHKQGWVEHWPRLLGVLVFLVSLLALWMPIWNGRAALFSLHGLLLVADVALAVLFYLLTMRRRKWVRALAELKGIPIEQHWAHLDNLYRRSAVYTTAYIVALLVVATIAPVWLGFGFGSAGIAVLGFSALTATGNFLVRSTVLREKQLDYGNATQFPVLSILLVFAFVFSFFNDNHQVRLLSDTKLDRPALKTFAEQWAARNPSAGTEVRPMVFVAAAGGGIRAAQWTGAVLTYLDDQQPKFAESVFAISGVSGGSVGAAFYSELKKQGGGCSAAGGQGCLQAKLQEMLAHDFLGPNVSALLFNDLLQRFLPIGFLPDRQRALERGWERAWSQAFTNPGMAGPYSHTWSAAGASEPWRPLLLLNTTHMETGRKAVISPFPLPTATFADDVDVLDLLGNVDMPLSAAAGNSARFTYVSPPGTLPYDGGWLDMTEDNGHLLDGGYYDNNGALTLQALLQTLQSLDGVSFYQRYAVKPIVVLITNDDQLVCEKNADGMVECPSDLWLKPQPEVKEAQPAVTDFNGRFTRLTDNNGANESTGPIRGLLSVREGHGIAGVKSLIAWVNACGSQPSACGLSEQTKPEFFHFRLDLNKGETPPALGWVLSEDSEQVIWNKMKALEGKHGSEHNQREARALLTLLDR